ncbi:MAG: helix-turn-helix domain-containing protein [Segniliparus sp.]|uniref:helix-turn-helix domain-containing protein n=1 Tax=Segniliparus sp. TaxID=2804064 RepID=UPI003F3D92CA
MSKAKATTALRRKGVRVLGSDRTELQADLKAKYEAGASIRSLAQETGRSYGFVHKVLVESKTALRARGGAHTSEPEPAKKSSGKKK